MPRKRLRRAGLRRKQKTGRDAAARPLQQHRRFWTVHMRHKQRRTTALALGGRQASQGPLFARTSCERRGARRVRASEARTHQKPRPRKAAAVRAAAAHSGCAQAVHAPRGLFLQKHAVRRLQLVAPLAGCGWLCFGSALCPSFGARWRRFTGRRIEGHGGDVCISACSGAGGRRQLRRRVLCARGRRHLRSGGQAVARWAPRLARPFGTACGSLHGRGRGRRAFERANGPNNQNCAVRREAQRTVLR